MLCEICHQNESHDKHHITSKCFGGTNHKSNIAYLCPNCHRSVHLGKFILEGKFQTTSGFKLIYHKKGEPSITGNEPKVFLF